MTPKGELSTLRLSLMRVAQAANRAGADLTLPHLGQERGFNRLCSDLIDWIEQNHPPAQ